MFHTVTVHDSNAWTDINEIYIWQRWGEWSVLICITFHTCWAPHEASALLFTQAENASISSLHASSPFSFTLKHTEHIVITPAHIGLYT